MISKCSALPVLLLIFCQIVHFSQQLDCSQIKDSDQVAGKTLKIPESSTSPVDVPANFNCTYKIKPPSLVYAQVNVTSNLKNFGDVITVTDWKGGVTKIVSNATFTTNFYVFSQTETTVNVATGNSNGSQFLITISYVSLPVPLEKTLDKTPQNLNYYMLDILRRQPITVSSDDKLTLTVARSSHTADQFSNYYVIDGNFSDPKSINKLSDLSATSFNFKSTGNQLTVVGLDNQSQYSSIIFTPANQSTGYSKFAGVTVADRTGTVNVNVAKNEIAAVMVVAKNSDQLVLTTLKEDTTSSNCILLSVTGPPSAQSQTLIDFYSDTYSIPQLFPFNYFTFIAANCSAQLSFSTKIPGDYYEISDEKSGFIFSPSYFNSAAKSDFNVTYTYTGTDKMQFSVDIDSVAGNSNGQLDVNIYDEKWQKMLSTVITGDESGTRSRAFGKYLNVQMSGGGSSKLRYRLSSSSFGVFGFTSQLSMLFLLLWIIF
uniref:CUB_2 domain-containing protein n=1 Tax=Caenorhabditis japonica TaxID=281687 RepID=A0A8R1DKS6_CAEJA